MRKLAVVLLLTAALRASGPVPVRAQDAPKKDLRLMNLATELIVEPRDGARTAACDVLLFTPDGKHLLAAGDDKAVRIWPFSTKTGLDPDKYRALRWSAYREQRGSIYALALDRKRQVAIAGAGLRPGSVAVMGWEGDEKSYRGITAKDTGRKSRGVTTIWSLAFSSSGKQVAYGGIDGSVWLWPLDGGKPRRLGLHPQRPGGGRNHVRLVVFIDRDGKKLLSVAADGLVLEWDTAREDAEPVERFRFAVTNLSGAAVGPGKRWLAAFGQDKNARRIEVRSLAGRLRHRLDTPDGTDVRNYPKCLAFDATGDRLAVGYYSIPDGATFQKFSGGGVALYDLTREKPLPTEGPPCTYYPEALAFHPGGKFLAVAGGDDHEVTVWRLDQLKKPFSRVVSPGRCLWGVGLSADSRFLGFLDERTVNPAHPNERGKGSWKVFDLSKKPKKSWALPRESAAFAPVKPLRTLKGWTVEPSKKDAYLWYVDDGRGRRQRLPLDRNRDAMPRCYTFLKGDPVRLVVGHLWGLSVFELGGDTPKLVRKFVGHQGEVMAVAPSADHKALVSAGRDQTVSYWRLTPWPHQRELGARFFLQDGRLYLDALATGSPAWEARLRKGDEVLTLVVDRKAMVYNRELFTLSGQRYRPTGSAAAALKALEAPVPARELYFIVRRAGQKEPLHLLTTVRQRPLWRFFATRDGEWVLWRYHDFYYDTSTNGDFHIGWLLSRGVKKPIFDRAEQFRKHFHRPEKVAELIVNLPAPARISPLDVQPPSVVVHLDRNRVKDEDVKALVTVTGSNSLGVGKTSLWVNDHLIKEWTLDARSFREEVPIPNRLLRRGRNMIVAQGFNRAEVRRDTPVWEVVCDRAGGKPDLYTLAVGVGDYRKIKLENLSANKDAEAVNNVWKKQQGKLFKNIYPLVLKDSEATRERILKEFKTIHARARADDVLLVFLGGHGASDSIIKKALGQRGVRLLDRIQPRTFVFCTSDFDFQKPLRTGMTGELLYKELRKLRCRKIVMLDACHSGTLGLDPVRELSPAAAGPVIYSACAPDQSAYEDRGLGLQQTRGRADGLFAIALLLALEKEFDQADKDANNKLDAQELAQYFQKRVPRLLRRLTRDSNQTPRTFLPPHEKRLEVAEK